MDYSTEQLFHGYFVSNPIFIDGSDRQRLTLGIQVSDYVLQKKVYREIAFGMEASAFATAHTLEENGG